MPLKITKELPALEITQEQADAMMTCDGCGLVVRSLVYWEDEFLCPKWEAEEDRE